MLYDLSYDISKKKFLAYLKLTMNSSMYLWHFNLILYFIKEGKFENKMIYLEFVILWKKNQLIFLSKGTLNPTN